MNPYKVGDKVTLREGIVACGVFRELRDCTDGAQYRITAVATVSISIIDDVGDTATLCYEFVDLNKE